MVDKGLEEFSGWKFCDTIKIVTRNDRIKGIQGYIVDPSNKSQLKSAINWAGRDYKEYTFVNEGFKMRFSRSADRSWCHGGKLSFWNCDIIKDGNTFLVGIDSELLLCLIKSSTIINGEVQESLRFASKNGNIGLVHPGMPEYADILKDIQLRQTLCQNKTSKWKMGHSYRTLEFSHIYVGDVYDWVEDIPNYKYTEHGRLMNHVRFVTLHKLRETPVKVHVMIDTSSVQYMECKDTASLINGIKDKRYSLQYRKSFPARVEDIVQIEPNATVEDFAKFYDQLEKEIWTIPEANRRIYLIRQLRYTATPEISESRLQLIKTLHKIEFDEMLDTEGNISTK